MWKMRKSEIWNVTLLKKHRYSFHYIQYACAYCMKSAIRSALHNLKHQYRIYS